MELNICLGVYTNADGFNHSYKAGGRGSAGRVQP
jgi:hypothetical protein